MCVTEKCVACNRACCDYDGCCIIAATDESRNHENVFDSKVFLFNYVRNVGGVVQHGLHCPTRYHTRCVFESSVVTRIVVDCVGGLLLTLSYHATIAASPTQRA